jgi:4-azaleucine resistance transporter AzlC
LFVNVRHVVYGLSLITKFKNVGKWKFFLIFGLTDETYALLTGCTVPEQSEPGTFYGTITLFDYLYWISGSLTGAIAGTLLPFSFEGVDFALTALFAVLLIDQLRATKDMLPCAIGLCVTTAAIVLSKLHVLDARHILLSALSAGIAVLILFRGRNGFSSEKVEESPGSNTKSDLEG